MARREKVNKRAEGKGEYKGGRRREDREYKGGYWREGRLLPGEGAVGKGEYKGVKRESKGGGRGKYKRRGGGRERCRPYKSRRVSHTSSEPREQFPYF